MAKEEIVGLSDKIVGRPIRVNKRTLDPGKKGYASVCFIGDVHLGSPQCDEARFARMVSYCEQNGIYVFLMGDLIEAAHRQSVGAGVYEQAKSRYPTIQHQHEVSVEYIRPLAEKGLVLGYLSGNHEGRVYQMTGVNIGKAFCRELSIPYLGDACWNYWRVGKQGYRVYTLHGASGSRYSYTKLKALVDISHNFSAELICMGHVHTCADDQQIVQYFDKKSGTVKERKKFLLITGHFLKYDGSYGQTKGMPIGKMGCPKVKLFSDDFDIHISW